MSEHQDDPHELQYKQWRGDPHIKALLEGPFYGMSVGTFETAAQLDKEFRAKGYLSLIFHGHYLIVSAGLEDAGQRDIALREFLTRLASEWQNCGWPKHPTIYTATRQDYCVVAVFNGEGLKLAPGYGGS